METNKRWIYVLKDPRDNSKRYVGMSKNPIKRLKDHIYKCKFEHTKKGNWIKKLLKLGFLPIMEVLKECDISEHGYWEEFYIKKLINEGNKLLNYDEKGVGNCGVKTKDSIEKSQNKNIIKIYQYSLDGVLINEYKSLREAERITGINHGNISKTCSNIFKHTSGYIFKKYDGVVNKVINPNAVKKKVIEIDNNGNEIAEYNSISEASKVIKLDAGNISRVCNGVLKKTNNRYFKFKNNE